MKRKRKFKILVVLMIFSSFAEVMSIGAIIPFLGVLTSPEYIQNYIDANFSGSKLEFANKYNLTLLLTVIFCAATILSCILRVGLLRLSTRLTFETGADLSLKIYRNTLYLPYEVHISRNSSEVIAAISNKTNAVIYQVVNPFLLGLSSLVMMLTITILVLYMYPTITLIITIGVIITYSSIVYITKQKLLQNSQIISYQTTRAIKLLQEGLGGIRDVIIDGNQKFYCNIYQKTDLELKKAQESNQFIAHIPKYIIESMAMVLLASIAYKLTKLEGSSEVIPILGALALSAQRLLPVQQQLFASWTSIKGSKETLHDVINMLRQHTSEKYNNQKSTPLNFYKHLELSDVSFRYSKSSPWIFEHINLKIKKGSKVGVIGGTGSGKSTLVDIILFLLKPTHGYLRIDGHTITNSNSHQWQNKIAHVPQSIYLADASIAENIAYGISEANIDLEKVKLAARHAKIAETIESWDRGYDTIVGERGTRLSGGQLQRIGIARALYKQAEIIILDEATSALDTKTEESVMDMIHSLNPNLTIIIVTHRLTTISKCDQVIEIGSGLIKHIDCRPINENL